MNDALATSSSLTIQTVDPKDGKAPKRRIQTATAALTAYNTMVDADRRRDVRFANIAGIYAGFPPIPPAQMEKQGMGDMPNVNTRQFEGSVDDYCSTYHAINNANMDWAEVEADHEDPMEAKRRSQYLTKCFNWAIKKWDRSGFSNASDYILESATRDTQMGLFGVGLALWRDGIDWRWKAIPTRRVHVPEGTNIMLDNCAAICVEDEISAAELYSRRKKTGWNEDQILWLIYCNQGARGQYNYNTFTYAQWVEQIRSNDTYLVNDFTPIPYVHIYVREFSGDGKITHSCFATQLPDSPNPQDKNAKPGHEFLYDKANEAEYWGQILSVFADNVGPEGKYHGVKGFGDRNYDLCHFENLMINQSARSAVIKNMPIFQADNEADRQKINQITFGFGAILMPDLQVSQVKIDADFEASVGMVNMVTRIRNQNNRKFPLSDRGSSGEAPTATQVNFDRSEQAQFSTLQIAQYRATGLDAMLAEMYRRIAQPGSKYPESWPGGKVAKEFRDKCEEFGIPEKELLEVRTVRASRTGSSGSMGIDVMKGEKLLSIATPGPGQMNARKYLASTLVGVENVAAFIEEPQELPGEIQRQIDHENLFIQDGKAPDVLGSDMHEIHLAAHLQLLGSLQQVVTQFMESGITPQNIEDAVALNSKMQAGIEHSGKHIQMMQEIRRDGKKPALFEQIVKESTKTLHNLFQISQAFGADIEKVAIEQQQAQAQQMSPEMIKAQAQVEINKMLAAAKIEIMAAQAQAKMGNQAMQHAAKTELKQAEAEQKMGINAIESVQSQEQQRAANTEKMVADAALTQQQLIQNAALAEQQRQEAAAQPTPNDQG